ncbi:hypothetical protein KYG_15580 [Acidovorax sp. NO-1]|uniref:hypothetical protein n=1 Tax=Acidovorax sp. NO-1 TaxID=512030 RepID=UPI00023FC6BE|nr:hypothetical protein [Acidovorax sp. NO-1]EHL21915.1 hypothetical protein KYG_15580 [Acidovorax sp. NO-1]
MNMLLMMAAGGLALVGVAHSVLGEVMVFRTLRTRGMVPTAGHPVLREWQVRILWATWHLASILGWALSALLWRLANAPADVDLRPWLAQVAVVALLASALLVLGATRGRHPAWAALLAIAALVAWH